MRTGSLDLGATVEKGKTPLKVPTMTNQLIYSVVDNNSLTAVYTNPVQPGHDKLDSDDIVSRVMVGYPAVMHTLDNPLITSILLSKDSKKNWSLSIKTIVVVFLYTAVIKLLT